MCLTSRAQAKVVLGVQTIIKIVNKIQFDFLKPSIFKNKQKFL